MADFDFAVVFFPFKTKMRREFRALILVSSESPNEEKHRYHLVK